MSFKISAVGPEGHTVMSRNTASEALSKAIELVAAGFSNVRIADRTGRLHAPEAFDRFFVTRGEAKAVRTQLQMTLVAESPGREAANDPVATIWPDQT